MKRRALLGRTHLYVALLAAGLTGVLMTLCATAWLGGQGDSLPRVLIGSLLCAGLGAMLALCLANIVLGAKRWPPRQLSDANRSSASEGPATGLPDRHYFEARLGRCLRSAARQQERVALILIDSDHLAGDLDEAVLDEVSMVFAERLRGQVRDRDLLADLGDGRFAVLLAPLQVREDAGQIGGLIVEALRAPICLANGRCMGAALSMGIARYPEDVHDPASLFAVAEAALLPLAGEAVGQAARIPL